MARVKLISKGVEELLKGSAARKALEPEVQQALDRAISSAPVASGEYQSSIHVEWDTTDRLVGRVVASAPHAMVVEANTGNLNRSIG